MHRSIGDMHAGNIWALDDGRGCYLDFWDHG